MNDAIRRAALAALERGAVVAAPTETFYGLLADATSATALDTLASLKPRGVDKGIGLLLPNREAWQSLVTEVPALARALADAFWPGPLTIALSARDSLDPRLLLEGSIAVRLGAASPAQTLATCSRLPLTATSANLPGMPPARSSEAVVSSFTEAVSDGRLVVVPGLSPGGSPSTVVTVNGLDAQISRAGAVDSQEIALVVDRFKR